MKFNSDTGPAEFLLLKFVAKGLWKGNGINHHEEKKEKLEKKKKKETSKYIFLEHCRKSANQNHNDSAPKKQKLFGNLLKHAPPLCQLMRQTSWLGFSGTAALCAAWPHHPNPTSVLPAQLPDGFKICQTWHFNYRSPADRQPWVGKRKKIN